MKRSGWITLLTTLLMACGAPGGPDIFGLGGIDGGGNKPEEDERREKPQADEDTVPLPGSTKPICPGGDVVGRVFKARPADGCGHEGGIEPMCLVEVAFESLERVRFAFHTEAGRAVMVTSYQRDCASVSATVKDGTLAFPLRFEWRDDWTLILSGTNVPFIEESE